MTWRGCERDRNQLWAEAVEAEHAAGSISLPERLWGEASQAQEARAEIDPWADVLLAIEDTPDSTIDESRVSSRHILDTVLRLPIEKQTMQVFKRVATVMHKLSWKRQKYRKGTEIVSGYVRARVQR